MAGMALVRTKRANGRVADHRGECAIRGRDQSPRKCNSLRLVAIEQRGTARLLERSGQLPSEIDRIADAGIHALPADRAMNMRGVAQQERASLAKLLRDAMMNAVGRKPIDAFHFDLEILNGAAPHIFKLKMLVVLRRIVAHRTDQPRSAGVLQREHREEVGVIEVDVQFAVHRGSGGLDIRNIEQMVVGSARGIRCRAPLAPGSGRHRSRRDTHNCRFPRAPGFAQGRANFAAAILEIRQVLPGARFRCRAR